MRESEVSLREKEDIVPKTSFEVMFHLRQVEVWAMSAFDELMGVMEKVDGKIKYRSRDWSIVDGQPGFVQVPSPWSVVWH